jgi:hypothetical protein
MNAQPHCCVKVTLMDVACCGFADGRSINKALTGHQVHPPDDASPNQRLSMHTVKALLIAAVAGAVLATSAVADDGETGQKFRRNELEFFEKKIRPVLVDRCYSCHSADAVDVEGGLRVDLREGLLRGGETGPAVVPEDVRKSLLIAALEYKDGIEMPPEEKLPEDVIRDFRRWVRMGAPDPRDGSLDEPAGDAGGTEVAADLWSLQLIQNPQPPDVSNETWPRTDVDRFLLARMESEGLQPVAPARPETLLRRVTFDLTGLPPTPEEVLAFMEDPSDEAYLAHVDKLLASPQFGERWARHWFDVARYGESAGSSRDVLITPAWRYRDYVIDAINDDIPFDRFITEQIAGDLLEASSPEERTRLQIATGLLAIGSKSLNGGNIPLDIVDDQIDVISKAVLGLTVSCARCHDHKFDPIPTADYYAMAGIFKSTQTHYGGGTNRPDSPGEMLKVYLPLGDEDGTLAKQIRQHEQQLEKLTKQQQEATKQVQQLKEKLPDDWQNQEKALLARIEEAATPDADDEETDEPLQPKDKKLLEQIDAFKQAQQELRRVRSEKETLEQQELPELEFAVGVTEAKKIADSPIHIRGERQRTGDVVPRGMLSCIPLEDSPAADVTDAQSGRLELARWLAHPRNPLPARVAVNRIWSRLFGTGIVETVTDFGSTAPPPTHPELLDHLAYRFIHELHWSRKALIRELVLSRAYRISNEFDGNNHRLDEANTNYWRRGRQRLEAEAIRDALLAVSGELNLQRPHASPVATIGEGEVGRNLNTKPLSEPYPYRSVYLPIIRGIIPEFLKAFDFPEPSNPQGQRVATNVPAQSLFLMNNPFVIEQSEALAERLIQNHDGDDAERVREAYLLCFSRMPSSEEIETSLGYVESCRSSLQSSEKETGEGERIAWATFSQALFSAAEFRYVE